MKMELATLTQRFTFAAVLITALFACTLEGNAQIVDTSVTKLAPPPPPPPPPTSTIVNEPGYKVVEFMPMFPGCDTTGMAPLDQQMCAQRKMLEYVYSNIQYPDSARIKEVEGTAVVTYVIEKDGAITNARIVRNPGAGTGEEALRIVETFPNWIPGRQRGETVRVQFNLPIKFRLN